MLRRIVITSILFSLVTVLYVNYNRNSVITQQYDVSMLSSDYNSQDINIKSGISTSEPSQGKAQNNSTEDNQSFDFLNCLQRIDFDFLKLSFDEEEDKNKTEQYLQSSESYFSMADPLYYALYATPPEGENRLSLLFEYFEQDPSNPIVASDIISLCANSSDNRCTKSLIKQAISFDRDNGATWLYAANFYAAKDDIENFINSIVELEKSQLFNERYGEKLLLYTNALEGSPQNNFQANIIAAIGKLATAESNGYSSIIQWCIRDLQESIKTNACLSLGQQLERRSIRIGSKVIGITLQSKISEFQGNIEAIKLRQKKIQSLTDSLRGNITEKSHYMMLLDDRLMRFWLNNLDLYGEIESMRLVAKETETLYKDEYSVCTLLYQALGDFI
ncbi:hypothetical protein [Colwellia psychrerythraea]|uniref:Uncharacterized protein n=1 Tax=Colwellia psychrerythraea TaxID=28229 RepID=A0A099KU54_COLPS|nr:hypothetical protein [Colwellia psychrerythraea]KGJ93710.1 hypothetical protein ND2E_2203 [Colwellia psychrerythraea]